VAASPSHPAANEPPMPDLLGHPRGLFMLFFAELWERFSFYGMRALLVLYMVKSLAFADKEAYGIYGAYNGFVYLTPLLGGMLADRLIGYRRAVTIGGLLMAAGQFTLMANALLNVNAPPGTAGTMNWVFFLGLALLITGNGYFKPNISTMVGKLYRQGDPRRDAGFTIFYMGINMGAFLSPLLCGYVGEKWGWHWGFAVAGTGMLLGQLVFNVFHREIGTIGYPPNRTAFRKSIPWVILGTVAFLFIPMLLVQRPEWVEHAAPVLGLAFLGYIVYESFTCTKIERHRIFALIILTFFSILFWAFFEQAGSSINVFTDREVNRTIPFSVPFLYKAGDEIPASQFQSVNALFIILLAPLFSGLWVLLRRKNADPNTPLKFALALLQIAAGFYVLYLGALQAKETGKANMIYLIVGYFLHTTGELCLSPVGLSMVTKMAPVRLAGLLMGMWFLSSFFAHVTGGVIAKATGTEGGYADVFLKIVYVSGAFGVGLILLSPLIKWLMHEHVQDPQDPVAAAAPAAKPAS
jgi:POT family proton-dependent oligopeptide transporter